MRERAPALALAVGPEAAGRLVEQAVEPVAVVELQAAVGPAPEARVSGAAASAYAASRTGRDRNGLPAAENRHGSSTALVIPIRRSTVT